MKIIAGRFLSLLSILVAITERNHVEAFVNHRNIKPTTIASSSSSSSSLDRKTTQLNDVPNGNNIHVDFDIPVPTWLTENGEKIWNSIDKPLRPTIPIPPIADNSPDD